MKLFLHWLLWDLRRFRTMLLVWTLLLLGYAGFLAWLQSTILTVDRGFLQFSLPAVAGLILVAGPMLLCYELGVVLVWLVEKRRARSPEAIIPPTQ